MKISLKKKQILEEDGGFISYFHHVFTLIMSGTVFAAGLNKDQKRRAEQLTSIFENGKTEIQYGYVEALDDGRGFGRAGFTTATGDALEVVRSIHAVPNNKLKSICLNCDVPEGRKR